MLSLTLKLKSQSKKDFNLFTHKNCQIIRPLYTLKIISRYLEKKMKTQGKFKKDDCITKAQVLLVLEGTCLTGRD